MSINKAIISGNLTRDPELRSTTGGMQVLNFGVAVNDRRKNNQTGQWEDKPNFIDCVMFGNRAESVSRFLSKGAKVAVEGKLSWSQWQDKQTGQNRSKIEVLVDEIEFLSTAQSQYAPAPQQAPQYAPQQQYQQPQYQQQYQQPQRMPQPAPQQATQQVPTVYVGDQQPMQQPSVNAATGLYDEDIAF